jgi:hypothetical protein
MVVPYEEVGQPVADLVWKVELGQFLHQGSVLDCVKCLAKVQRHDDDVRVGEQVCDCVEEARRATRTKVN